MIDRNTHVTHRRVAVAAVVVCLAVSAVALPQSQSAILPLIEAVRNQDHDAVRALLREQVDVNAAQPDGATPLHWAAHWDNRQIADVLELKVGTVKSRLFRARLALRQQMVAQEQRPIRGCGDSPAPQPEVDDG